MTDDAGIVKLEQRPGLLHITYTHSIAASMGTLNDGESPSTRSTWIGPCQPAGAVDPGRTGIVVRTGFSRGPDPVQSPKLENRVDRAQYWQWWRCSSSLRV